MTREELDQIIYERIGYFVEERVLDCIIELIAAEREPATHGEISEKFYNAGCDRHYRQTDYRLGWQAAERFHGIKKEDKT